MLHPENRLLEPQSPDVGMERLADDRPENTVEVERREVRQPRQFVDRQRLGQVVFDVVDTRLTRRR